MSKKKKYTATVVHTIPNLTKKQVKALHRDAIQNQRSISEWEPAARVVVVVEPPLPDKLLGKLRHHSVAPVFSEADLQALGQDSSESEQPTAEDLRDVVDILQDCLHSVQVTSDSVSDPGLLAEMQKPESDYAVNCVSPIPDSKVMHFPPGLNSGGPFSVETLDTLNSPALQIAATVSVNQMFAVGNLVPLRDGTEAIVQPGGILERVQLSPDAAELL